MANTKTISIPSVLKLEKGVLDHLGEYLAEADLHKVVVFYGNGLINMFGDRVSKSMQDAGVEILYQQELDDVHIEDITALAFSVVSNQAQAVLGIGGGKVLDSAKYTGFLRRLPFVAVPTSASSDGFSSASASLLVGGRRTTVPAKLAHSIFVDTEVIRTAPKKFLFSGIGDMVAKITALYDWQFEVDHGCGEMNDVAMMVSKKAVNSFVRTPFESILDDLYLKELLSSLTMSGIANEIAGDSSPTSGSEHLISHALDKILPVPQLHGVQVGVATYLMALVQEHRVPRIRTVLTETGFWDFACTQGLRLEDFITAIDMAPSIKPYRHVYLHEAEYREKAKALLTEDPMLRKVFGLDA